MKRSAAAIAAILSRLGVGRAPSFVVRASLARPQRAENSDQKLGPTTSDPSKPILHNVKAAASKVRVQLRFDSALLARADAAADHQGITRTAWLHRATFDALEDRGGVPPTKHTG
jgi:hypothetical protein